LLGKFSIILTKLMASVYSFLILSKSIFESIICPIEFHKHICISQNYEKDPSVEADITSIA